MLHCQNSTDTTTNRTPYFGNPVDTPLISDGLNDAQIIISGEELWNFPHVHLHHCFGQMVYSSNVFIYLLVSARE